MGNHSSTLTSSHISCIVVYILGKRSSIQDAKLVFLRWCFVLLRQIRSDQMIVGGIAFSAAPPKLFFFSYSCRLVFVFVSFNFFSLNRHSLNNVSLFSSMLGSVNKKFLIILSRAAHSGRGAPSVYMTGRRRCCNGTATDTCYDQLIIANGYQANESY